MRERNCLQHALVLVVAEGVLSFGRCQRVADRTWATGRLEASQEHVSKVLNDWKGCFRAPLGRLIVYSLKSHGDVHKQRSLQ